MIVLRKIGTAATLFRTDRVRFWDLLYERLGLEKYRRKYWEAKLLRTSRKKGVLDANDVIHFQFRGEPIYLKIYEPADLLTINVLKHNTFSEHEELEVLSHYIKQGSVIVDVGANVGNHTVYFAKILKGYVYSFEPQNKLFSILKKNVELNSLQHVTQLYNIGLSNASSKASIDDTPAGNIGGTSIRHDEKGEMEVKTLDEVFRSIPKKIDFMKIDVEGFEYRVIEGAEKTIREHEPLIFVEIWFENRLNAMLRKFDELDYTLVQVLSSPKTTAYVGPNFIFKKKHNA